MDTSRIIGYSVINPVRVDEDYLRFCVDYAIRTGVNHLQIIGPIHDTRVGNLDGMTLYKKYSQFNEGKDLEYIAATQAAFAQVLPKAKEAGMRLYVWHHELELPDDLSDFYPETLNDTGDYEVTSPVIKDFIENKVFDFFDEYPTIDGIILTLHETKVPLLKLQHQKLGRSERVEYVTRLLYDACAARGKELIVRPFASIPEDYSMLMEAYARISPELVVMDKWTQFDWSLCAPHNSFFDRITVNPLMVEADVFGEFFGKGRLPLMLLDHIAAKAEYCESYHVRGYCARIDRNGMIPFGDVNEVNLAVMDAAMAGRDMDGAARAFFAKRYPGAGPEVFELMRDTENVVKHIIYLKGFLFSELSYFPRLNHSKNHFYFEMMRDDYRIESGEWFIPNAWDRGSLESVREEKAWALRRAEELLAQAEALRGRLDAADFDALLVKFRNLRLVAAVWQQLTEVFYRYEQFFVRKDAAEETALTEALSRLEALRDEGLALLGDRFYCFLGDAGDVHDFIGAFTDEVRESFAAEKAAAQELGDTPYDYVLCGAGSEGHAIKKEVNYSDTLVKDGEVCRIPGHNPERDWGRVNTHGWFSYELRVKPGEPIDLLLRAGSYTDTLALRLTVDGEERELRVPAPAGRLCDYVFRFANPGTRDRVRVRIDRVSADTPFVSRIVIG